MLTSTGSAAVTRLVVNLGAREDVRTGVGLRLAERRTQDERVLK